MFCKTIIVLYLITAIMIKLYYLNMFCLDGVGHRILTVFDVILCGIGSMLEQISFHIRIEEVVWNLAI